jgi:hypothetical protein
MRIKIDWRGPLFSFYRGDNLLLELRVWPVTIEHWHVDATAAHKCDAEDGRPCTRCGKHEV